MYIYVEKATQLLKFTIEEKKNFIYESTGSRFWIYEEQMKAAKKNGMFVELIYVETQLANCLSRAQTRGIETCHFVPEESVRLSHKIAQDFFPDLREHAHQWKKYNNDGPKPRLVESYKAT
jgi:predicted ABC-type ATPase